jgi:hypothetical protein
MSERSEPLNPEDERPERAGRWAVLAIVGVGAARRVCRARRHARALLREELGARAGAIEDHELVPRGEQALRHRTAHRPEPDESHLHERLLV